MSELGPTKAVNRGHFYELYEDNYHKRIWSGIFPF